MVVLWPLCLELVSQRSFCVVLLILLFSRSAVLLFLLDHLREFLLHVHKVHVLGLLFVDRVLVGRVIEIGVTRNGGPIFAVEDLCGFAENCEITGYGLNEYLFCLFHGEKFDEGEIPLLVCLFIPHDADVLHGGIPAEYLEELVLGDDLDDLSPDHEAGAVSICDGVDCFCGVVLDFGDHGPRAVAFMALGPFGEIIVVALRADPVNGGFYEVLGE